MVWAIPAAPNWGRGHRGREPQRPPGPAPRSIHSRVDPWLLGQLGARRTGDTTGCGGSARPMAFPLGLREGILAAWPTHCWLKVRRVGSTTAPSSPPGRTHEWCHAFCAAHGVAGSFSGRVWRGSRRTPQFFPDAVTLAPAATAEEVLTGIDVSAGASVKDSFATLDLAGAGFRQLFTATWLWRGPKWPARPPKGGVTAGPTWRRVVDLPALRAWETAWGTTPRSGASSRRRSWDVTRSSFTRCTTVRRWVGGAVLHRGSAAVGVSNIFDRTGDPQQGVGQPRRPGRGRRGSATAGFLRARPGSPTAALGARVRGRQER